jgi:KDO2-lipid IV(A) lauroyltransferase
MHFQDSISGQWASQAGLFIGRHAPRWAGYGVARIAANVIALRKPRVYRAVWANLRQIAGPQADDRTLRRMARRVFLHAGQTYYDFFHAIGQPPETLTQAVRIPESLIALLQSGAETGRGVLFLGIHMSNFDLGILALGAHGLSIQVLSLADPAPGFRFFNRLRSTAGLEITPITPQSLRAAVRRLKSGGTVSTGFDRPVASDPDDRQDRELVELFGRPAPLPLGPVRLALMTGATVVVGCCQYRHHKGYVLEFTGPIEMARTGDRRQDILANTRQLAVVLEGYVRAQPEQWLMFHPFWPESPAD